MIETDYEIIVDKTGDSTESSEEIAACIGAVLSYTNSVKTTKTQISRWSKFAKLERAGITSRWLPNTHSMGLWSISARLFLYLALFLVGCTYVHAQDLTTTTIPPYAPSYTNYNAQDRFYTNDQGYQPYTIRVALALNCTKLNIDVIEGVDVRQMPQGDLVAMLPAKTSWIVNIVGNNLVLNDSSLHKASPVGLAKASMSGTSSLNSNIKPVAYFPSATSNLVTRLRFPLATQSELAINNNSFQSIQYIISPHNRDSNNCIFALNGKPYRGSLLLKTNYAQPQINAPLAPIQKTFPRFTSINSSTSNLSAINVIGLEDYLLSVVPSEMPSQWAQEALKAQAIAARSYAVANLGKHAQDGFDVKATVEDQVYSGVSSETGATNKAVADTEGLVLKQQGKVIPAFFHSTSGGSTEEADVVWGKSIPYLKSVPDFDHSSPYFHWQRRFTVSELETPLTKSFGNLGKLLSLMVIARSGSQRSLAILICGTRSSYVTDGETLRHLLHLPSTIFEITCDNGTYTLSGRGYGHGLGLSQWGAKALAERGYDATQILMYYYRDILIEPLNKIPSI